MEDTFKCPECGSGVIEPSGDTLVCASCGHSFWTTDEARARLLSQLIEESTELSLASGQGEQAQQAESAFRNIVSICRDYAEDAPDAFRPSLATALNNLGVLLFEEGRDGEAEPLYREAIEIQRDLVGREPDILLCGLPQKLVNLADLLKRDGRLSEAEELYREALDIWLRVAAEKSLRYLPEVARTIATVATLLIDMGRKYDAKEFTDMAHELRYAFQEVKEVLQ